MTPKEKRLIWSFRRKLIHIMLNAETQAMTKYYQTQIFAINKLMNILGFRTKGGKML